ncbi:hypothetical protein ZWY2020_022096 [Hordeum vulgare]|nr:hypothetical protein ZWY2020_022096 [Hordeum vulgare]
MSLPSPPPPPSSHLGVSQTLNIVVALDMPHNAVCIALKLAEDGDEVSGPELMETRSVVASAFDCWRWHGKDTQNRNHIPLADPLGYVPKEDISYAIKAIISVHCQNGSSTATLGGKSRVMEPKDVDLLNITSMSCLALPLCPLAQTEVERGILPILKRIRAVFDMVGIKEEESVLVRITGCPNGCARPYMAEVGFVGDGPNSYQTTLAETFMNKVKLQDIEKVLEPLFSYRNSMRQEGESFGSFTNRMECEEHD